VSVRGDADYLFEELNKEYKTNFNTTDIGVLRTLSDELRDLNWECRVTVREGEVIAINPLSSHKLGLAIDLGTTKVAGYLINLSNGQTISSRGVMNPQISYGEDIISRISSTVQAPEKTLELQCSIIEALNKIAKELCLEAGVHTGEIVEACIVCNTAMHHLLLGLPVRQLALSPFVPAIIKSIDIKAHDIGLKIAPGAIIHFPPNIAAFIGSDHVAMLLVTEAWKSGETVLSLDIGTNTEVSLVKDGRITSVSCASGPAFEGGHIKNGMRAARGAIEKVQISGDNILYQTIDGAPPVGICGSGIIDAMSQLYKGGIVDEGGRLKAEHPGVSTHEGHKEFVLVAKTKGNGRPAIVITQPDIRELQLAKAAIRAGIQALLEANNCPEADIKCVIIAGAFGSYINIENAITIGMLPVLPAERFQQVGNAAGMGAKQILLSIKKRAEAISLAQNVNYLELASAPGLLQTFSQACYLGHYQLLQGKREKINQWKQK